jgi:hypothetical protein
MSGESIFTEQLVATAISDSAASPGQCAAGTAGRAADRADGPLRADGEQC